MTSPMIRILGALAVLVAFPMFLILAAVRRSREEPAAPAEWVLIPPLSGRDGQ